MAIIPLQLARVSNALRAGVSQRTIARTQQSLVEVQNQIATGKRLISPSDNPGAASIAIQLRKTLEQRTAYAANLQHIASHLGEVDSSLGDLTSLLREAQTIASANVGTITSPDQRAAAAAVIDSLYNQAVSLGNRSFRGTYLFGGDRATQPPFAPALGGMRFNGSERILRNSVDETTLLPFQVDADQVFGGLSTRVRGTADLSPRLTADTRIGDLRGAAGEGVRLGTIILGNGFTSQIIDLAHADTIGDVINAINAAGVGGITASIASTGLVINGGPADDITIADAGSGNTAADLGILRPTGAGPGAAVNGQSVAPRLTPLTRLADLSAGAGIDVDSGIILTNGVATATITFSSAVTVEDLLNAINRSGTGVLARINADATGIDLLNPVQGIPMTIAENGGTTAADLGIRSFGPDSPLSQLNGGRGVRMADGDDLRITRADGTAFNLDVSNLATVQDVIDAINAADAGGGLVASFAAVGNGILLTDTTGGPGPIIITPLNGSQAAPDLGLAPGATFGALTGKDVHAVETTGLFANLAALRAGLIQNDDAAITTAAEALQSDLDRVVRIRGQVGAQVQDADLRLQRLEEQNVATQALLSAIEDTDYNEAITRFQTLQTALQANLQTTGRLLNLSLLDFLG